MKQNFLFQIISMPEYADSKEKLQAVIMIEAIKAHMACTNREWEKKQLEIQRRTPEAQQAKRQLYARLGRAIKTKQEAEEKKIADGPPKYDWPYTEQGASEVSAALIRKILTDLGLPFDAFSEDLLELARLAGAVRCQEEDKSTPYGALAEEWFNSREKPSLDTYKPENLIPDPYEGESRSAYFRRVEAIAEARYERAERRTRPEVATARAARWLVQNSLGKTYEQIASAEGVSVETVKLDVSQLRIALGIQRPKGRPIMGKIVP